MKTLVGIISGLLLLVAVAGFAPEDASADAFFAPITLGDDRAIIGCVDNEVADNLSASGAFILVDHICSAGHILVVHFLP